jgi:hypothetical protein
MTMLRRIVRSAAVRASFVSPGKMAAQSASSRISGTVGSRLMSTQSGDDTQRPSALAYVHLADGTTLKGRSFGAHKSVEGEVS